MDVNADGACPKIRTKYGLRTCSVCKTPEQVLFGIPPDENRYKKWFLALNWSIPPEKLKYILRNARVCSKHFSDSSFTSTLKNRLNKFACPSIAEGISTAGVPESVIFNTPTQDEALPLPASNYSSVENKHLISSPTVSTRTANNRVQTTPKTKKIRILLSSISKLKKRLYNNRNSSGLLGQLQAKLADKPHLFEFIRSQLHMQGRANKGRRWSTTEKSFALNIYLHSPSAYRMLQKHFAFPSKATLHRYTYNVSKTPGFCPNLIKCLKTQSSRMSDSEKLCVLSFDEMSIKHGLMYATDLDCVDGFSTFRRESIDKPVYATEALVFMARGIVKNWKQVLGYYFTSPTDNFSLKSLIIEAIDILHSCQLEVVSIVCDQGPRNKGLFTELNVTLENPSFMHNDKKIYAMYDPPHLLKSVRNNLMNHGIYYKDTSIRNGSEDNTPRTAFANWKHIVELYQIDSKAEFSACRKLTKKHIVVSGLKKMNVKLAAQVLSHTVAVSLSLYVAAQKIENNAIDTARFIKKMDTLFDTLNSRTLKHSKKELCAVTKDSCHIKIWNESKAWIKTWEIRSSAGKKIVAPCKNGWILTINAFLGISDDLLRNNKFILTNRFSQDVTENTFASIRRRGGFRENPNTYEFRHTIQKVIITNFFKQSSVKNCQDDDAYSLIDFTTFNKKELFEVINSEDCSKENVEEDVDTLSLTTLNSIEENVLCYISGYFVKKYLSSVDCLICEKLLVDKEKVLDNHTFFLYFKEYDYDKSGLNWPVNDVFQYFVKLHECFMTNFHLFYEKECISKKFSSVLYKINMNLLDNHEEHKEKVQVFFISSFIRMMIKHKVKMLNKDLKSNYNYKKKAKHL